MRSRYLLAPALLTGAFALTAHAQDDRLLRQQEQLQKVAVQKVEATLKEAVADARRLRSAGDSSPSAISSSLTL